MKKFFSLLTIVLLALSIFTVWTPEAGANTFWETIGYAFQKAGRGLKNIALSPLEIPVSMINEGQKNPFQGLFIGPAIGAVNGTTRALSGVLEFATFPAPPYNKSLYNVPLGTSIWD